MRYKFLLYLSYSYGVPIGRPLEKEVLKRGYEIKWFTYIPKTVKDIPKGSLILSSIEEVIDYNPDIILTIADYVPDFLRGLKVQVFHGFNPNKRDEKEHFTIRGFFDLYCTQGPSTTHGFKKAQNKHRHFEVIETGWPKMDALFKRKVSSQNDLPVILITSTFSRRLSLALREDVFQVIKRLSETGKYNFIVTLHPKLPNEVVEKWKELENQHFTYYDTRDIIPLFLKADIMFSDTSSAIQEFMLTHKPIVTFLHHKPDPCVINVTEADKIESALGDALSYPKEKTDCIKEKANKLHPYRDGRSAKRVIDAALWLLHADKTHLRKKPLNLIRKYKVRKQFQHYTLKSYRKPYTLKKDTY